jgi:hypothetical protein
MGQVDRVADRERLGCTPGSPVEVAGGDHAAWFIV